MNFTGENKISSKISNLHERSKHLQSINEGQIRHLCSCLHFYIQAYHDPMLKLSIMTEEELAHLFGDLDAYIPLHEGKSQQRGGGQLYRQIPL